MQIQRQELLNGVKWESFLGAGAEIRRQKRRSDREERMRELVAYMCMAATGLPVQSGPLCFQYLSRSVAKLEVPFSLSHQELGQRCAWAYVDESWCWRQRMDFHIYRRKRPYTYARAAAASASEHPLDPFCLAVIIALAQQARRTSGCAGPLNITLFMPQHKREESTVGRVVTSLTQYTAVVTDEYLQKFDNPYGSSESTLDIHQTVLPLDRLLSVYTAIRSASGSARRDEAAASTASTAGKKRKALDDITDTSNESPRAVRQKIS